MQRIVINKCFGGFGLSDEAFEYYLNLKGIKYGTSPSQFTSFKDSKNYCDLEHVGRNYFAVVVLISQKIRQISHNSREIIQVFYFTGL